MQSHKEKSKTLSKVKSIIEVSAAAHSLQTDMCKYRSEDDANDYSEPSFLKVDHKELLTDYGLATKAKQIAPTRGFFDSVEDKRDILSDHNHYKVEVKRSNFVTLFLDELAVDRFVACHLYGYAAREIDLNLSHEQCSEL